MVSMHDYTVAGEAGRRDRLYGVLGIASLAIVVLVRWLTLGVAPSDSREAMSLGFFVGAIAPLGLFGVLLHWFDTHLWRTRFGVAAGMLVGVPMPWVVRGRYFGTLTFRSGPSTDSSDVEVVISQTWRRIHIALRVLNPKLGIGGYSDSLMASLDANEAGAPHLRYVYSYRQTRADGAVTIPFVATGTCFLLLTLSTGRNAFAGDYYSDEGGSGTLTFTQVDGENSNGHGGDSP
jgi:hypothetical protein